MHVRSLANTYSELMITSNLIDAFVDANNHVLVQHYVCIDVIDLSISLILVLRYFLIKTARKLYRLTFFFCETESQTRSSN